MLFCIVISILAKHNDYSKDTNHARQTDKIPIWYRHHCLAVQGQDTADAIACSPTTLTKLQKWYQILKINLF
jgi:hypothetical protein